MIEPEVRNELQGESDPETVQARVLDWTVSPDLSALASLSDKRERLAAVRTAYYELKRPVLDRLREVEGLEVDDLPASSQVIVRTTVRRWRDLTAEGSLLDRDPSLRVLPNTRFVALTST